MRWLCWWMMWWLVRRMTPISTSESFEIPIPKARRQTRGKFLKWMAFPSLLACYVTKMPSDCLQTGVFRTSNDATARKWHIRGNGEWSKAQQRSVTRKHGLLFQHIVIHSRLVSFSIRQFLRDSLKYRASHSSSNHTWRNEDVSQHRGHSSQLCWPLLCVCHVDSISKRMIGDNG